MAAVLAPLFEGTVDLTYSTNNGLVEMSTPGVTEATGLAAFAAAYGVDQADVIAFGDIGDDGTAAPPVPSVTTSSPHTPIAARTRWPPGVPYSFKDFPGNSRAVSVPTDARRVGTSTAGAVMRAPLACPP